MRVVDDGLGTIHVFTGTKSNGKQFQELMKDYRYLEQEIVDLKSEIINKDKEIERLKKREKECIDHYLVASKYGSEMEGKVIELHSIIKEVREYIEETCYYDELENYSNMTSDEVKELLEILDKENK